MRTKKVFMLKNIKSPYIEQAIFILREDAPEGKYDVVREAEKIVESYMGSSIRPKKKSRLLLKTAAILITAVAIYFITGGILR